MAKANEKIVDLDPISKAKESTKLVTQDDGRRYLLQEGKSFTFIENENLGRFYNK